MTLVADEQAVLVLRQPEGEGNFSYRVAEIPGPEADRLEQELAAGRADGPEIVRTFGDALSLSEVMTRLDSRDFRVIDYHA